MVPNPPTLALVQIPRHLVAQLESTFSRVWTGRVARVDAIEVGPGAPVLAVVAGSEEDVLRIARSHGERAPDAMFVAVTDEARRIRSRRGGMPANVAWAVGRDELEDPRLLGLSMRYALEVAARRRAERRITELVPQAQIGALVAATIGEVADPLTALLTNLEVVWTQAGNAAADPAVVLDRAELSATVTEALEGARHLARAAGDLHRASARSGRVTAVDVRAVVETAARLAVHGPARVEVHAAPRACAARADESALCQVLVALLVRATGALPLDDRSSPSAPRSSTFSPGPAGPEDEAPRVEIELLQIGAHVIVRLQPLPAAPRPPSGIGRWRELVERMDGTLELLDGGAVELRLPATRAPSSVPPTLVPDGSQGRARVLVAGDNPLVARAIGRALTPAHHVVLVGSTADAVRRMSETRFDLVLVDLSDGGRDVYDRISPDQSDKLLYVTGGADPVDLAWLEQRGLQWIRKPFGAEDLRTAVTERLGRG